MANNWSEDILAKQKLNTLGANSLTDAELLGILIGKGTVEQSAIETAKELLRNYHNNLSEIACVSPTAMKKSRGMDGAKALYIAAALELGRRMKIVENGEVQSITKLNDIIAIFQPMLGHLKHEEVWVIYLTSSNKIIEKVRVSHGGIGASVFDVKLILKRAIEVLATGVILVHNHPSSDAEPSKTDIVQTRKFIEAARWMDIKVLDHVIISENEFYSFLGNKLL